MGRVPRWRMGKGVYHVFNRGINSAWILSTPEERDFFCKLLFDQKKHFKIEIYHYAVMSNHFHLAIETLDTKTLSAYIGRVSALYSRYWHRTKKAGNGTVWQGRFKSLIVQKELYLNRLGRYIERNPVVAEIEGIENPEDYQWSSATSYVSEKTDKLIVPSRHPYRLNWGDNEQECRTNYKAYIGSSQDDDERNVFTEGSRCLGDEEFQSALKLVSGRLTARKKGRRKVQ
jgi:putative transposase